MIHSLKPKKRCQQICNEHQFILIPKSKSNECWIKSQITLDYCPVYNEYNVLHYKRFTGQFENIVPIQNFDIIKQ